jgi:hypothetical protein
MRLICAAAMIVLLSGPAFAQFSQGEHMQQAGESDKEKTHSQIENEKAAKRAYERSLGTIPDKAAADPWGTVRNDAPPKAGPAKPRIN